MRPARSSDGAGPDGSITNAAHTLSGRLQQRIALGVPSRCLNI
jgi:hypothetical protein